MSIGRLFELIGKNLEELENIIKTDKEELKLYSAGKNLDGKRGYDRVFPRDSITSALLLKDKEFLKNILIFCANHQGKRIDPFTGEEPGAIPHEWPGVDLRGKNTLYASIDTSALFIIGFGKYFEWTGDSEFIRNNAGKIKSTFEYIKRHLDADLMWDNPQFCNSDKYALWAGCWRDGGYCERRNMEHAYPASYFMVNAFVVNALRMLASFAEQGLINLNARELLKQVEKTLKKTIETFWLGDEGYFASATDNEGIIRTFYLDSVVSLYFLEKDDVSKEMMQKIAENLKKLETDYGYLTRENLPGYDYEGDEKKPFKLTIWPYENACVALLAERYGLKDLKQKCFLLAKRLSELKHPFTEYLLYENRQAVPVGCNIQLWTIAYAKAMKELK